MVRVAFVTCRKWPEIAADDRVAAEVLAAHGAEVTAVAWNADGVDWTEFDRVVIRSTWDYHYKENFNNYVKWVKSFSDIQFRLWNPTETILANLDKAYLATLAGRGAPVVPTVYTTAAEVTSLLDIILSNGWDNVVIKPSVSASAVGVWRSSLATAVTDQERFLQEAEQRVLMVQPYMPEIMAGEWSLVFFGGEYSHAAIKIPSDGLRVQKAHGGRSEAKAPDIKIIGQAQAILNLSGYRTLYARVDGIISNGTFMLMELELNEPALFFLNSTDAARRFSDAILRTLD